MEKIKGQPGMFHIRDRLGRSACGANVGKKLLYLMWRWQDKKHTCSRCAEIYQERRLAYSLRKITGN